MSTCPFCGRDPFHYADNGIGMEAVAVECCDLGDLYFRGARPVPDEITMSWDEFSEIGAKLSQARAVPPTTSQNARDEIIRLMREDFDPHPNYELPAGQWDDNADDVADKIIAAALSESTRHISDAWRVLKKWLADYAEEEASFSRYRDDVMLDGIMTAGERRKLSTALAFQCCKGLAPDDECGCARLALSSIGGKL